ncbi:MAG TPA: ATP-binding protein [Fibrobacteria bacterium]|nr:ATP-binding protein [Fibrobacteria bacterium]
MDRLRFDNPWWQAGRTVEAEFRSAPRRAYFPAFHAQVSQLEVHRSVLLMGPRRVGKTWMMLQCIDQLMQEGVSGSQILFASLETPIYTGLSLEAILKLFLRMHPQEPKFVFFDEIQYLPDWERHLKSLTDSYRKFRFVGSGSAAAALRRKSQESGAGRFTDFLLPPLSFAEYLRFAGREADLVHEVPPKDVHHAAARHWECPDIWQLNREFVRYLNLGGFPEAVMTPAVGNEAGRYIRQDIIEKVLLRDLPSLYGIQDVQELNRLFNVLAYNSGNEVNLESLSRESSVTKITLSRYLDYLEAAFLIRRIDRVDQDFGSFQRATRFKVYLTNPTMRAALFGPMDESSPAMGAMAETAVFCQWLHSSTWIDRLRYARWRDREVDMVGLDPQGQGPASLVEVKWSDHPLEHGGDLKGLLELAAKRPLSRPPLVTTLTRSETRRFGDLEIEFIPTSLHCYTISRNLQEPRPTPKPAAG